MDLHSYTLGEHGRFEQILNKFLLKCLHIILDSRAPNNRPSSRSGEIRKSDKWFNLVLGEHHMAMESLSSWNRSLMEPMIVDVILVKEPPSYASERASRLALANEVFCETVLERWIVQYEHQKSLAPQTGDASYKKTYKKLIILLRSLYSMLRLLPAYKAFRKLNSLKQNCDFDISYKVSSFSSPFSRMDEESMSKYSFFPVDMPQGRLSVIVVYRKDLSDFKLESVVSCPPEIITDYVGSPLADPMRAFPSTSSEKGHPTSSPMRVRQSSCSNHQRPHSWTSGLHRDASSKRGQTFSGSPPLFSAPYEYSPSPAEIYTPGSQHERFPDHHKTASDDFLSPPFSSSPSPSPPTYFSGGNTSQGRLHSETAPMSIPYPMIAKSPRYLSPNFSDPNRNSLPPLSPRHTKHDSLSHESPSGIRTIRRLGSLKSGELSSGPINVSHKLYRDAKEDSGRFSSLLSSSSSPRAGFSRSSSRLSFQDDLGDYDFSCPFIVDDVDPPDSLTSLNLFGRNSSETSSQASSTTKKSQDAAVGALVHMLKTAPPLQQDSSIYTSRTSAAPLDGDMRAAYDFFKPKKTSDAFEELRAYKEMKDLLVSKSALRMRGKESSES